jgi:hypothetical protein
MGALPARPGVKSAGATFAVLRIAVFLDVAGSRWDRSVRHNAASKGSTDWVGADLLSRHGSGYDRSMVRKTMTA